jgi:hypothetical protein
MIETNRMSVVGLTTHFVGNFGLGEDIILSKDPYSFKDEKVQDIFFNYLLSGFKNDIYYRFRKKTDLMIYNVKDSVDSIFDNPYNLFEESKIIAKHLYQQTINVKVKGGEIYIAYIKNITVDGVVCDAVGIFKSESRDNYIKVDFHLNEFSIETDSGINPKKLDKGVLIFNIDKENGYKATMIDNSSRISSASTYWCVDFLDMNLKPSPYLNTLNYINQCVAFCDEMLTEENNVTKHEKNMVLNNSVKYFDSNSDYEKENFEKDVLIQEDIIKEFREHQDKYFTTFNIQPCEKFQISQTAVKKNSKYLKSIIKLDNNFNIQINGNHDLLESGYDEDKKMKFYKVFYINEEN